MHAKMKGLGFISLLILLLCSHLAYSRSIREDINLISDGVNYTRSSTPAFLEWRLSTSTVTCEPIYGFLPCSTNVWGLLFLIVVYEILLSIGGQYIGNGSNLFLQIIGPGVVGGSLFQFLGTIPQIIMVLASSLSGDAAAAQQQATTGMALVVGRTVMVLTLIWGLSVVFGSYDQSENETTDNSESQETTTLRGSGVVTDVETSYSARIILITLVPFLILQLQNIFDSLTWRKVVILIVLIITAALLIAYMLYQSFQPWIRNRCFEYVTSIYNKDKLLKLISRNGKPDTRKIQGLFNKINKNNDASVSATELRVLLLGLKMDDDDDDISMELYIENMVAFFDTSGDGSIDQDEFINGMTKLASDLSNQTPAQSTRSQGSNSQNTSEDQQGLLASSTSTSTSQATSNSWLIFFRATFFLIGGTVMILALGQPLTSSVMDFAQAANLSSFWVTYFVIPLAMNYGTAIQSITSARQKTQRSISLTLSSLYSGVYMNNIMGLLTYLVPVYARNLSSDIWAEVLVVLLICIIMGILSSFYTTFPRWTGYLVLLLYPISLATIYVLTSVSALS